MAKWPCLHPGTPLVKTQVFQIGYRRVHCSQGWVEGGVLSPIYYLVLRISIFDQGSRIFTTRRRRLESTSWRRKLEPIATLESLWRRKLEPVTSHESPWRRKLEPVTTVESLGRRKLEPVASHESLWRRKLEPVTTVESAFGWKLEFVTTKSLTESGKRK